MSIVIRMMRSKLLLLGLAIQIIAFLPGVAFAVNNWGPPYTNHGWVADSTGYQNAQDAIDATVREVAATCSPTPCATQVIYFSDPLHNQTVAEVLGNPSAQFPTASFVDGTLALQDPRKNAGGCEVCKKHNGTNSGGSSPKHSSGDAATDATFVAGSTRVLDPVNAATGAKYQQDTDFRSSKWLTFRRFYTSDGTVPSTAMGSHWRHSFDRSLQLIGPSTIVAMRPDGFGDAFTKNGGVWTTDVDVSDTLIEQDDGSGNPTGYTLFVSAYRETEQYSATGLVQSVTDSTGAAETFAYSTGNTPSNIAPVPNLLLTVTDPNGRTLNFTYDSSKRVHTVVLPDGGTLTYGYDAASNLTSITFPDTHVLQYVYNESSLTGGGNYPHAMTGTIDEKGTRFESTKYSGSSQVSATSFAGGVDASTISYGLDGPTLTTPLGNKVTFDYSTEVGQYRFVDYDFRSGPCGNECNQPWSGLSHDSNGYVSRETDLNGNINAITNNSLGLETQRIAAQGKPEQRTINITWDNNLRVPLTRQTLNASGVTVAQSAWVYNARGQVLASCEMDPAVPAAASYTCSNTGTVPTGVRRTVMTYCDAVDTTQCPVVGLILTRKGPRTDIDDTTTYRYYMTDTAIYQHGDIEYLIDALGHRTTFISFDGAGRVLALADANGATTNLRYTPRGWLASKNVGVNATTTYTYTSYGALETVTDPDGVVTTYSYDDAHRLTKITDTQGNYIQYTLDASGNRTAENVYTSGSATPVHSLTRQFNKLGQLVKAIDGLNHTVFDASASGSYDLNGNLVQSVDGLGFTHKQSVDALNRVVSDVENFNGTDAATQNTTISNAYDALDRLTQVSDPSNLATNYTYDGLSNQTGLQSPDTGASSDTFDAAGNRLTHTDAKGVVSTSTYDALNRLLTLSFADATLNVTYHYDEPYYISGCPGSFAVGRVSRVIESAVTTTYCYDARGNVSQKVQVQGVQTDTTSYVYTPADRLSQVTYPSGTVVQYARNNLGQIASVTTTPSGGAAQTVVSNVTYLPFGPVSSYTLGNGQVVSRNYDANYQLLDLTSPNFNLHFTRDVMGDVTSLGNSSGVPNPTETYNYDPLYRLASVNDSLGSTIESYTYNKTGDRLSKTSTGGIATGTYAYQPGTHWLTSIGSAARSYDLNGNTTGNATGGQTFGYGYDGRNRLTVAQVNQQTVGAYTYSASGQRIAKAATSPQAINERFSYDEASRLLGEYGTSSRDYVWMDDLPVAAIDGSGTSVSMNFVVADGLGTPRSVSNASGTQIWQWAYQSNAFGEKQPASVNGYTFNLRYPGQYFDLERNVAYNANRDYDPTTGRYLQSDPIGLKGGITTYGYVLGNPLNDFDFFGLDGGMCRAALATAGALCGGFAGQQLGTAIVGSGGALVGSRLGPEGAIGGALLGGGAGGTIGGTLGAAYGGAAGMALADKLCEKDKPCPPCRMIDGTEVAVGTIGYRYDQVPPSVPHWPLTGSHYHLFVANQNPNNCQCLWSPLNPKSARVTEEPPPPGAVEVKPFMVP